MGSDLHLPDGQTTGTAALVLHPHPRMGGTRHHPLVVAIAEGLASHGIPALRPDLADPDVVVAAAEATDAADELLARTGAERLLLVGYSWGAAVAAHVHIPAVSARVLVAPVPVAGADAHIDDATPTLVLVPADDQYGGPAYAEDLFGTRPGTTIEVVPDADHFLAGAVSRIATRAVAWAAAR